METTTGLIRSIVAQKELSNLFNPFPKFIPYIGENYFDSNKRVLTVEFAYSEDTPKNISIANNIFSSKESLLQHVEEFDSVSVPQKTLLGNTPASTRLRKRIRMHLPKHNIEDIAFYYFLPFSIVRNSTKINPNDKKIATELFEEIIKILKPQQIVFFGNVILNNDIAAFLEQQKISFETISLRADFSSRSYNAEDISDSPSKKHGLQKLVQISSIIKSKIDFIPNEIRDSVIELLDEIDFMNKGTSRANASDVLQDKKIQKYIFLKDIVQELKAINKKMYMKDLGRLLNANDFRSAIGKQFDPYSRGVYNLVDATINYYSTNKSTNDWAQDIKERFIPNTQTDDGNTISATLMAIPLERKYGYKSVNLNTSYGYDNIQEERNRIFGDNIPSDYAPKNATNND